MAQTVGLVACVRVGTNYAFTTLVFPTTGGGVLNDSEHFVLWYDGQSTPSDPDARMLAKYSMWVSLLQDAMAYNFSVTITHEDDSSAVQNVQVGSPLMFW